MYGVIIYFNTLIALQRFQTESNPLFFFAKKNSWSLERCVPLLGPMNWKISKKVIVNFLGQKIDLVFLESTV